MQPTVRTVSTRLVPAVLAVGLLLLLSPAPAAAEPPPGIAWVETLAEAFKLAKEQDKPIMICINAKRVDWGRREPAAKELRNHTYRDAKVKELAKKFVCAFLTDSGTSKDFGELRFRYGIDGDIVSPQHIFAYPDGKLLYREEFWPYGTGQKSVDALLKMMNDALAKDRARRNGNGDEEDKPGPSTTPGEGGDAEPGDGSAAPDIPAVPEDAAAREAWIQEQLRLVTHVDERTRRTALKALVDADKDGDIVLRLIEFLPEYKKLPVIQVDIIRALGRPGLEVAAQPLAKYLGAKDDVVRANTAVTLEYIGSKSSIADLRKKASREKVAMIANHMYRALGRCGAGDAKVRALLVKKMEGAKDEVDSFGPIIGLAYFEKDAKAAKAVRELLARHGIPVWRRGGGGGGGLRRALLTWCLTEVGFGNEDAAAWLEGELIPKVPQNRWSRPVIDFYKAAARVCRGDEAAKDDVNSGVRFGINRFNKAGDNPLMDDARRDRDQTEFEPKGEWGAGRST